MLKFWVFTWRANSKFLFWKNKQPSIFSGINYCLLKLNLATNSSYWEKPVLTFLHSLMFLITTFNRFIIPIFDPVVWLPSFSFLNKMKPEDSFRVCYSRGRTRLYKRSHSPLLHLLVQHGASLCFLGLFVQWIIYGWMSLHEFW